MRYVIDPTQKFDGAVITCMTDDVHCDFYGNTIEQIRERDHNPNLTTIGPEELNRLHKQFISELHNGPVEEITEEEYWDGYNCLPPARVLPDMFFIGEPYHSDVFPFCFTAEGRYFRCRKRLNTSITQLREEVAQYMASLKLENA